MHKSPRKREIAAQESTRETAGYLGLPVYSCLIPPKFPWRSNALIQRIASARKGRICPIKKSPFSGITSGQAMRYHRLSVHEVIMCSRTTHKLGDGTSARAPTLHVTSLVVAPSLRDEGEGMHAVEEAGAIIVAVALFLSVCLFVIDVFVKARYRSGPVIGLVSSVLAILFFLVAFADKLPGHPVGLRGIMLELPGIHEANKDFHSSPVILIVLFAAQALRLGIYTRLFIIPAFTMSEAEYHSRAQTANRANDLSAPVLAYITFSLAATALVAGVYGLPAIAGVFLCIFLLLLYLASSYLWNLERAFLFVLVQFRILVLYFWLYISAFVVFLVIVLGRIELWRTRKQDVDELFFADLTRRMRVADRKIRARIAAEQEQLRNLTADDETGD